MELRPGLLWGSERVFLTADWRFLAMLNYEVSPAVLLPRVPFGTELDLWQGKAFVSLVGFLFLDARLLGFPIPFHRNFEEVNLRYYVRRRENSVVKRGVAFIREIVPKWALATVARVAYNENYHCHPMAHRIQRDNVAGDARLLVEYSWRLGSRGYRIAVKAAGEPYEIADGSTEEFIAEHYWAYCATGRNRSLEYHVTHPRWRVWKLVEAGFQGDVEALYGREFAGALSAPPASAFLAEGSAVSVYGGKKLAA